MICLLIVMNLVISLPVALNPLAENVSVSSVSNVVMFGQIVLNEHPLLNDAVMAVL